MQFARSLAGPRFVVWSAMLVLAATGLSRSAHAQAKGAFEMGYDVGLAIQLNDGTGSSFGDTNVGSSLAVPASDVFGTTTVRLGYLFSERSEIESRFGFASVNFSNDTGGNVHSAAFGLDYAQHFGSGRPRTFLRAGGRWNSTGREYGPDVSQFGVDGGFGAKPGHGHQLATRVDLGVARFFETANRAGHWDLSLTFGISFFTR